MKIIKAKGKIILDAMVDDEDYDKLVNSAWLKSRNTHRNNPKTYLYKTERVNGKLERTFMHRMIMNLNSPGLQIDHIDGNTLNNQKSNLRICTNQQNQFSYKIKRPGCSSKFRGVSFKKSEKKWYAQVRLNPKTYSGGLFKSEEEAARARDRLALKLHGEFAHLNFPRENYENKADTSSTEIPSIC